MLADRTTISSLHWVVLDELLDQTLALRRPLPLLDASNKGHVRRRRPHPGPSVPALDPEAPGQQHKNSGSEGIPVDSLGVPPPLGEDLRGGVPGGPHG
eukprot:CAMPEP_0204298462 /NCGR_PEP_ID=MMETSP0468-20130131/75056_1 /ASSEMBLY_ACC=CAM_ASM_000383 /TAXON_ID=2969 /ORGANISM="Oxyrrhis marina" /LENGTH=97 /DNA_ID=CAMNT_0051277353 /DNA_START=24 /DNA_END=317 /DNA_ORIENTATION=-